MARSLRSGPALPDRAEVVVIGGAIVGCSVAYHLTRRHISDVVLLEQGTLTCGTTWHAAGLVSQLKSTHSLTRLATYSARLFEELEDETGQATGYRTPGSISVADNEQRWEEILRGATMSEGVGIETRVIDLDEAKQRWLLMHTDDLVGALYIPRDGQTSPVDTTMALAKGARSRGARVLEGVSVTELKVAGGKVTGVVNEAGEIETETVVLATGMWTRHLATQIGIDVPLQACEHFYIVTETLEGMEIGTPTLSMNTDTRVMVRLQNEWSRHSRQTGKTGKIRNNLKLLKGIAHHFLQFPVIARRRHSDPAGSSHSRRLRVGFGRGDQQNGSRRVVGPKTNTPRHSRRTGKAGRTMPKLARFTGSATHSGGSFPTHRQASGWAVLPPG